MDAPPITSGKTMEFSMDSPVNIKLPTSMVAMMGQRQRVTIARALANQPAIIWADEPTGNLDRQSADDILTLMRKLNREQGQTFVIVTHDRRIGELCDRIVQMRDGQITDQGQGAREGEVEN